MHANRSLRLALLAAPMALLAGCISLGEDPPDRLLTLTAEQTSPAGTEQSVARDEAIVVHEPEVPAAIDVNRVPVQVTPTELAYLQDAVWVEKPSRLFRRLLAETIRVERGTVVLDGDESPLSSGTHVHGTIRKFGYDVASGSVVMQFDAMRIRDGVVQTQRFEASEPGVLAEAAPVGAALNRAANDVARQVSAWVAGA